MAVAKRNVSLSDILRQMGMDEDANSLRDGAQLLTQRPIELEDSEGIGAERYERTSKRSAYWDGYWAGPWETRVGKLDLRLPKVR